MVARQVLLVGLVLTGIALGSQASNAGAAEPCFNGVAVECQDIYVPLDRAGSVPGSVRVYAERIGEDARRPQAVVYLAGGPGQAATPDLRQFATAVEPVLDRADIILSHPGSDGDLEARMMSWKRGASQIDASPEEVLRRAA